MGSTYPLKWVGEGVPLIYKEHMKFIEIQGQLYTSLW